MDKKQLQGQLAKAEAKQAEAQHEISNLRKLLEQADKQGPWVPESGEHHYYVNSIGAAYGTEWSGSILDHARLANGCVFRTKERAEKAAPLRARAGVIIAAAFEADPDAGEWSDERQWAAVLCPCYDKGGALAHFEWKSRLVIFAMIDSRLVFVHTEGQAQHMADILSAMGVK